MPRLGRLSPHWLILMLMAAGQCLAAEIKVEGVDERIQANVRAHLSADELGDLTDPSRRAILTQAMADQARQALIPFGYHHPVIDVELARRSNGRHLVRIQPGPPIRIEKRLIRFHDHADLDSIDQADLASRLELQVGDRFDHGIYEQGKRRIGSELADRGFLEARLKTRKVRIDRLANTAEIELSWSVGARHTFGPVRFEGAQFEPGFLARYQRFEVGDRFSQSALLRLHQALSDTQYFARVDIQPLIEEEVGHEVPIRVRVTPNARNRYELGASYGTDSGIGVNGEFLRRWVNTHGHRFRAALNTAVDRSGLEANYRIPKADSVEDYYVAGLTFTRQEPDTYEYDQWQLSFGDSREWHGWRRNDSIAYLDEDFVVAGQPGNTQLLLVKLALSKTERDDSVLPTRGWQIKASVEAAAEDLGSDTSLVQVNLSGKRVWSPRPDQRFITRANLGATWVDRFDLLPPSLRYFTGGDRTLRGYAYETLGPRNARGQVIGGEHLLVASAEYEWAWSPNWRFAVFSDAGNAFSDGEFDPEASLGLGLRYVSPLGLIRLDVAQSITDDEASPRLHFVVGPEL